MSDRNAHLASYLSWLKAATDQGYLSRMGNFVMVLPDWLGSIGYDAPGQSSRIHRFVFDTPEQWANGARSVSVLPYGVLLELAFVGALWLYLPFPQGVLANPDDAVVIGGKAVRKAPVDAVPDGVDAVGSIPCFLVA